MADLGVTDLLALNDLLQPEDEAEVNTNAAATPSSIVPRRGTASSSSAAAAGEGEGADGQPKKKKKDPKDIWDEDEVPPEEAILAEDLHDPRPRPVYEVLFKQDVMSEDVFLGIGDKTPGTSDCTHMVVRVQFPGHQMRDLDLDVTKNKLRVESRTLLLSTYLPMPCDPDCGSAKWDAKKETLIVTLPILRDEW